MFTEYLNKVFNMFSSVPFDTLMYVVCGTFAGIFLLTLIACFLKPGVRAASKRPFLCLVNAYSAVILAAFLLNNELSQSVFGTAVFWVAGYLLYGVLCFVSKPSKAEQPVAQIALSSMPVQPAKAAAPRTDSAPAKSIVRLEHAISVTDKLLQKNLGKSDRQELEKLKNTLAVLQLKGNLSPTEADILNENFNTLLKLMAKYNM